jgi:glucans biosynthesis protein
MTYQRNTSPMLQSPRCGAKTRANGRCRAPAVRGKARCRMHGGAAGSGAPRGNRNALKHGVFTKEALERRTRLNKLIREANRLLKELS